MSIYNLLRSTEIDGVQAVQINELFVQNGSGISRLLELCPIQTKKSPGRILAKIENIVMVHETISSMGRWELGNSSAAFSQTSVE